MTWIPSHVADTLRALALAAAIALAPGAVLADPPDANREHALALVREAWDSAGADSPRQPDRFRRLPIGIFDSGTGGLAVLEEVLRLDAFDNASGRAGADGKPDFARERFVFLADQANMPYGNYPSLGRTGFLKELAVCDAAFLLARAALSPAG